MKRIIPILIVILICISVIPFAVSASTSLGSYINISDLPYSYNGESYNGCFFNITYNYSLIDYSVIDISSYGLKFIYCTTNAATLYDANYIIYGSSEIFYISEQSTLYGQYVKFLYNNGSWKINAGFLNINDPNYGSFISSGGKALGYIFNKGVHIVSDGLDLVLNKINYSSTYTLSFNSNGGSSISPITDITSNTVINLVDQYGNYLPQYVPTKQFYVFSGWALSNGGTNVSTVTITENTILYANWNADSRNTMITYYTANGWINYYGNQNHTMSPPSLVLSGNNVSINVYYEITNQAPNGYYLSYFNIEENGTTYRITPDALYINLIVNTPGYIQITPVFTQLKTLTVAYNPTGSTQDNTMEFGVLEPVYRGGASVTLTGSYAYPMFITKVRLVGNNTHRIYEIDFQDSWDEQENNFYFEMYFTMPDEDSTITVFWSVMGGVAPLPVVSYDESGNAYFMGVSEENLFSQDFSGARDLIPEDFVGIVEYFGALQGLSIVVSIILVAGFAAFLLRRA